MNTESFGFSVGDLVYLKKHEAYYSKNLTYRYLVSNPDLDTSSLASVWASEDKDETGIVIHFFDKSLCAVFVNDKIKVYLLAPGIEKA